MLINLTNTNKKAIIDDKNCARVMLHKWHWKRVDKYSFYVATSVRTDGKSKTVYLHRLILQAKPGMDVHHKDENTLNNVEENLVEVEATHHRSQHCRKFT